MSEIKALLIDLDKTLAVEEPSALEAFEAAAAEVNRNYPVPVEEFVTVIRQEAKKLWHSLPTIEYCKQIAVSSWEGLWAEFSDSNENQSNLKSLKDYYQTTAWINALKVFAIDDRDLAVKLRDIYKSERRKRQKLFPDTLEFLLSVKNKFKLAIITNGTPDLQWFKINVGGLKQYFDFVAIAGEIGLAKPATKIFTSALQALNVNPFEAVMIGDRLETDIQGALNSGIESIWVNRRKIKNESGIIPDFEVFDLMGIIPFLEL